jgi:hypothetical protein
MRISLRQAIIIENNGTAGGTIAHARTFSGIGAMIRAENRREGGGNQPSNSEAGLRPPPSAADGLDRACCPALVGHQAFDVRRWAPADAGAHHISTITEASYTKYLTFPPSCVVGAFH